jgi:hypothetical protein
MDAAGAASLHMILSIIVLHLYLSLGLDHSMIDTVSLQPIRIHLLLLIGFSNSLMVMHGFLYPYMAKVMIHLVGSRLMIPDIASQIFHILPFLLHLRRLLNIRLRHHGSTQTNPQQQKN